MPILIASRGLAVTAAPGTGSTSLLAALEPIAEPLVSIASIRAAGLDPKHATVGQLIQHGLLTSTHGLRIVTSTRNPYDFWVAEWNRSRTRWAKDALQPDSWVHRVPGMQRQIRWAQQLDFPGWLDRVLGPLAVAGEERHLNHGHVGEADITIRLEDLSEQAPLLFGLAPGSIPHVNRTATTARPRDLYDPPSQALVSAVHRPDLERFGYSFAGDRD